MFYRYFFLFCSIVLVFSGCQEDEFIPDEEDIDVPGLVADSLQLNQIQVIGSHNSYRLKTYEPIYELAQGASGILPASLNPDGWDYEHLPLDQQFGDYGVRQIELDIYYDPDGGRFANRAGNQLVGEPVESGIPELDQPGFKVLHVADLDYRTNYYTFKEALQAVKDWSDAHSYHLPIFILIETKQGGINIPFFNFTEVLNFDATAMDAIDQEIKDVFGENLEGVLTPDDVRGNFATLNDAIKTKGWPKIGEVRGKVAFLFNNGGDVKDLYLQGHPSLEGRIMFVDSGPDQPESAFIMRNDAFSSDIEQLVSEGYIIRTRADANTVEARSGDVTKRDRALASGAQFVSTDYYRPDPRHDTSSEWTDYVVHFADGKVARLNPVNGPQEYSSIGKIE